MPASWSSREIRSWTKGGRPSDAAVPGLFSAAALDAFETDIVVNTVDMAAEAAVVALQEATDAARSEVIARQSARAGGIPPLSITVIDGKRDAPASAITPDSQIVLLFIYMPEIARRTYEALVERSPHDTGRYIEGLLVFVDGEPAGFQSITVDTTQVQFVASVPYARRLEVGKDRHGRAFVKQVAPHIVEETAIIAKRKFGDLANVTYQYVDLAGAYQIRTTAGLFARHFEGGRWRQSGTPRTRHGVVERHIQYPAILITPRD